MKKCLIPLVFCMVFLTGCSSHKVYSINTDKATTGKLLETFAITNGFNLAHADSENGIYKIETNLMKFSTGIFAGGKQDFSSGFGVRLKEVKPNCTMIISDSFGYGLQGHIYNKTKRYIKRLKEDGYTIRKGNICASL
jgi:hypothetical protein